MTSFNKKQQKQQQQGQLKPEQLNDELEYHLHSWLPESAKVDDEME